MITREMVDSKETEMDALNKLDALDRIIVGTKGKKKKDRNDYVL